VRPARVILAQDNDPAGNDAAQKLAPRLGDLGISKWGQVLHFDI
jgi:hypothetical protein